MPDDKFIGAHAREEAEKASNSYLIIKGRSFEKKPVIESFKWTALQNAIKQYTH